MKFWDADKDQFKVNTLKRHLSVEIEVDKVSSGSDGTKLRAATKKWQDTVVTDGSIHGENAHETCTSPSSGDLFVNHINDLAEAYKDLSASCSDACGLHVHVNCSDLKFYDLRKVILLYSRIEQALFELCAKRRVNARFSRVCGKNYANMSPDPDAFKRQLLGKFYLEGREKSLPARPDKKTGNLVTKGKATKYITARYRALNLHSFFLRKTIEFRHHQGSVDANTIINWATICGHVIESANKLSEAEIRALPEDSRKALLAILPDHLVQYAKSVWRRGGERMDWNQVAMDTNKPDLPEVPKEEVNMDRKGFRKKHRAEKRARKQINSFRLTALRAIITGCRLDQVAAATVPAAPVPNPLNPFNNLNQAPLGAPNTASGAYNSVTGSFNPTPRAR